MERWLAGSIAGSVDRWIDRSGDGWNAGLLDRSLDRWISRSLDQ